MTLLVLDLTRRPMVSSLMVAKFWTTILDFGWLIRREGRARRPGLRSSSASHLAQAAHGGEAPTGAARPQFVKEDIGEPERRVIGPVLSIFRPGTNGKANFFDTP